MRFGDFLRTTVMLCASGASALILATLAGANGAGDLGVVWISLGWWLAAALFGLWSGRAAAASEPIRGLLAAARTQTSLPELAPARTVLNRLWPVLAATLLGAACAVVVPQVPAVVAGFMILWALAWRRQSAAVGAIEDRDGARFYVERTRPWEPIRLVRTPGFRASRVDLNGIHTRRS
ncbi:MAG TPA: hypothetical protein VFN48_07965 [Solirubrobacteraceae bacterium]|nr:hypothetical protein [Solirubrobacteraceae bacterium]